MKQNLRILFIGNSHTYYNDMPSMVKGLAEEAGFSCEVVMIAHGGWFLKQHVKEPDVHFNIRFGNYDYVVLQEHAHPFGPAEDLYEAAKTLTEWIREAGSKAVIYETWAPKDDPGMQKIMTEAHHKTAEENGALLAPVGENWEAERAAHPETELFFTDGRHASPAGSMFAAGHIFRTILKDLNGGE